MNFLKQFQRLFIKDIIVRLNDTLIYYPEKEILKKIKEDGQIIVYQKAYENFLKAETDDDIVCFLNNIDADKKESLVNHHIEDISVLLKCASNDGKIKLLDFLINQEKIKPTDKVMFDLMLHVFRTANFYVVRHMFKNYIQEDFFDYHMQKAEMENSSFIHPCIDWIRSHENKMFYPLDGLLPQEEKEDMRYYYTRILLKNDLNRLPLKKIINIFHYCNEEKMFKSLLEMFFYHAREKNMIHEMQIQIKKWLDEVDNSKPDWQIPVFTQTYMQYSLIEKPPETEKKKIKL